MPHQKSRTRRQPSSRSRALETILAMSIGAVVLIVSSWWILAYNLLFLGCVMMLAGVALTFITMLRMTINMRKNGGPRA